MRILNILENLEIKSALKQNTHPDIWREGKNRS